MSGFASVIKLGRPRDEVVFIANISPVESFAKNSRRVQSKTDNLSGETFIRVRRRAKPQFRISLPCVPQSVMEQIISLNRISDEHLSFVWAEDVRVISDRYKTTGLTSVVLGSDPSTLLGAAYKAAGGTDTDIIGIDGVFADYDPNGAQVSTNFFAGGGTYDAATRTLTLGTSPGPAGTTVFINWKFNGSLVTVARLSENYREQTKPPLWDISLSLEGV